MFDLCCWKWEGLLHSVDGNSKLLSLNGGVAVEHKYKQLSFRNTEQNRSSPLLALYVFAGQYMQF